MMKYATAFAAIAVLCLATSATQAETTVGYYCRTLPANADTRFQVPYTNDCLGKFDIDAVNTTTDVVTLAEDPGTLAAGLWYVRVAGGPLDGRWFTISAQNGADITLVEGVNAATSDADLTDLTTDHCLYVIRHWTLSTIFPDGFSKLTFPAVSSQFAPAPVRVLLGDSPVTSSAAINRSPALSAIFVDDGSSAAWFEPFTFNNVDNRVVAPGGTFIVRNELNDAVAQDDPNTLRDESTNDLKFYAMGECKDIEIVECLPVFTAENDVIIGAFAAEETTLDELNLGSAFTDSASAFSPGSGDTLLVYLDAPTSINPAPDDSFIRVGGTWVRPFVGIPAGDFELPCGAVLVVRKIADAGAQPGETVKWTVTQ